MNIEGPYLSEKPTRWEPARWGSILGRIALTFVLFVAAFHYSVQKVIDMMAAYEAAINARRSMFYADEPPYEKEKVAVFDYETEWVIQRY